MDDSSWVMAIRTGAAVCWKPRHNLQPRRYNSHAREYEQLGRQGWVPQVGNTGGEKNKVVLVSLQIDLLPCSPTTLVASLPDMSRTWATWGTSSWGMPATLFPATSQRPPCRCLKTSSRTAKLLQPQWRRQGGCRSSSLRFLHKWAKLLQRHRRRQGGYSKLSRQITTSTWTTRCYEAYHWILRASVVQFGRTLAFSYW